jgi:hypothetical protein
MILDKRVFTVTTESNNFYVKICVILKSLEIKVTLPSYVSIRMEGNIYKKLASLSLSKRKY